MKKVYILDSMSYIFRAFYAIRPDSMEVDGIYTNALYGFISSVEKIIKDFDPTHIVAAFDCGSKTFRNEIYPDYKANRSECPEQLKPQFALIEEYLNLRGIKIYRKENYEADDVIGTISKYLSSEKQQSVICSSDKDMIQLLDEYTQICHTHKKNRVIEEKDIEEILGVESEQVLDYFSLVGDSVDNISGLPGVGPKGAVKLLKSYGNIEGIYKYRDEIAGPKLQQTIKEKWDLVELSKTLVTIDCQVSLENLDLEHFSFGEKNWQLLADFAQKYRLQRFSGQWLALSEQGGAGEKKQGLSTISQVTSVEVSIQVLSHSAFKHNILQLVFDCDGKKIICTFDQLADFASCLKGKKFLFNTSNKVYTQESVDGDFNFLSWDDLLFLYFVDQEKIYELMQNLSVERDVVQEKLAKLDFDGLCQEITSVISNELRERFILVETLEKFQELLKTLEKQEEICFDLETTSLDAHEAEIVGVGICFDEDNAYYIPLNSLIDKRVILAELKVVFEDSKKNFFGQNIKYDYKVLRCQGIELANISFDTLIASCLCNPSQFSHSLDTLVLQEFNYQMIQIGSIINKKNPEEMMFVDLNLLKDYCCEDIYFCFKLVNIYKKKLVEKNLSALFFEIELPLIKVLANMELEGFLLDITYLKKLQEDFEKRISVYEKEVYELCEEEFNLASPKQLGDILFGKLELPTGKKSKTGQYSTDNEVLESLVEDYPVAGKIINLRRLTKLNSTYVLGLLNIASIKTQRVHSNFLQTGTVTGRLSSTNPNLQNIPIREEEGRKIRSSFIVPEGKSLFCCDYSQVELRILAHISNEDNLIAAFKDGLDIHQFVASLIYDISLGEVTPQQRYFAKAVSFGIVYGQGARSLSKQLDISLKDASTFIQDYYNRYPKIKNFINEAKEKVRERGYCETIFNRLRYVPEVLSSDRRLISFADRIAVNTPIQGSAADIVKKAMIEIDYQIKTRGLATRMIVQVHDELVFEVPDNEKEIIGEIVPDIMENIVDLAVPLKVSKAWGKNWNQAK